MQFFLKTIVGNICPKRLRRDTVIKLKIMLLSIRICIILILGVQVLEELISTEPNLY